MSNEKDDEERTATVIQWPGTKRETEATTPAAPTPAGTPAATGEPGAPESITPGAIEDAMTLDVFERAIRQAVEEKLGNDVPSFPPRGADELVAQVFSALSGKDGKSALAEVRARLAEQNAGLLAPPSADGADDVGGSVIDLAARREARKQATADQTSRLGGAVKDGFQKFMTDLAVRENLTGEIHLDGAFLRQHGPQMLGSLFQTLAAAFMQGAKTEAQAPTSPYFPSTPTAPSTPPAPANDAAPPTTAPPSPEAAAHERVERARATLDTALASALAPDFPGPPPSGITGTAASAICTHCRRHHRVVGGMGHSRRMP